MEIADRVSWDPIIGNERVVEVCEKPAHKDKFVVEKQNFRCAFCGMKTDLRKLVAFQFCYYYGRYGCATCITGKQHIIPARILFHWDFRLYPVSNIANEFLEKTEMCPIYHPKLLCPRFLEESSKMSSLRKVEELRYSISLVMECIDGCNEPDCASHRRKIRAQYHQTRLHLFGATGDYSLHDFVEISSTKVDNMEHYLKAVFVQTKFHCENCKNNCRRKFSTCLLCKDQNPVFPWYVDYIVCCEDCQKLFHKKCCKSNTKCPSCSSPLVPARASFSLNGLMTSPSVC